MSYSQIPEKLDVYIVQGDTWGMLLTFTDGTDPINLTSYIITANLILDSVESSITITNTDLVSGQITLSLTNIQTAAMEIKDYLWYLKWTVGGDVRTVLTGTFGISAVLQTV